ncbi:hypothetical protein ASE06_19005 [Sphingopyxis sp. Root214]|jgi:hypothetical protein|uniref:hypothetical protein n=1 Tax=unclassified Sphingopyxis TaxID=2614943 RepID=UPI000701F552|nr:MULTISPECIES: hypothetical protein [unclassified Sphingopyxis]KQZ71505.1 hypothetical protein ASD73_16670 [Sphingopyxis sp. Root154]KRC05415.1 hypothetical protein ASE06_19005 [Sphingopyxis sp. Root214]
MPRTRNRLIVAARRSMLQRAELHRRLDVARAALKPGALLDRGKYRIGEKVDDTAHAVQQQFRNNRLPIAIAAAAGVAWLLRDPIKEHAPRLAQKIQDLATDVADHFRSSDEPADEDEIENVEEDDEAVR